MKSICHVNVNIFYNLICPYIVCFQMAYELHGMLTGDVSATTGEKVMPAYGGGFESFLKNIVTPMYRVIYEVPL